MLRRKVYDELLRWKSDGAEKCLIVKGPRQVGKTFIVQEFGREEYRNMVYINFMQNPRLMTAFSDSLVVDDITLALDALMPDAEFIPKETLIFIDEIQECSRARTALKSFSLDGRYDVIASGSLLGIHYRNERDSPVPVGYEREIMMGALDFEEFLWAMGMKESVISGLKDRLSRGEPLGTALNDRFDEMFSKYMVVGGMPEAVRDFVDGNSYRRSWETNRLILSSYMDDIERYTEGANRNKTRACMESIPMQLSRSNKKFVYTDIDGDTRNGSRKYEGSLRWLIDAGVVLPCHNLVDLRTPLEVSANPSSFKVYMHDTGLLVSSFSFESVQDIIGGRQDLRMGAIVENRIASCISGSGRTPYYFEKKGRLEIGFVERLGKDVVAIEVKSGSNRNSPSLNNLEKNGYHADRRIKLEHDDVHVDGYGVEHFPLFAAGFLDSLVRNRSTVG